MLAGCKTFHLDVARARDVISEHIEDIAFNLAHQGVMSSLNRRFLKQEVAIREVTIHCYSAAKCYGTLIMIGRFIRVSV